MLDLTRQEKIILTFLSLTFVTGLGINSYKKSQKSLEFDVRPYRMAALQNADKFIGQQRFVNINTSKIDELTRLPGVGKEIAQRIVQYRKANGPFKSKEELIRVQGIGEKKFESFRDLIVLEEVFAE